jgi:hypothetical protein
MASAKRWAAGPPPATTIRRGALGLVVCEFIGTLSHAPQNVLYDSCDEFMDGQFRISFPIVSGD